MPIFGRSVPSPPKVLKSILYAIVQQTLNYTAVVDGFSITKVIQKALVPTPVVTAFSMNLVIQKVINFNVSDALAEFRVIQKVMNFTPVATAFSIGQVRTTANAISFTPVVSSFSIQMQNVSSGPRLRDLFREDVSTAGAFYTPAQVKDVMRENDAARPDDNWVTRVRQFVRGRF